MPERIEIERPPHFRESPEERTEIYPTQDYASAPEIEDYPEKPAHVIDAGDDEPLRVDIGQPIPQPRARDWSANRTQIQNSRTTHLAGWEPNRTRLFIQNNDASVSVFLGRNETDLVFAMYELGPGESVEMWHQGDVWALCDGTDVAFVSVLQEYVPSDDR